MNQTANSKYDEVPYLCKAYSYAAPEHMHAIAKIFGLNAPSLEKARILDLGCGNGANIINLAINYPNAEFVGVDLSKVEIEEGQRDVKALNIKNLDLRAMSITDIDKSFGEFDYIICHGVFAWVPKDVQDAIFRVLKENLTKDGLALVSYNTLPGWNVANSFRKMLQFHTSSFKSSQEKIAQAKAFVNFLYESLEGSDTPYFNFLKDEIRILQSTDDSFLLHEYLMEGNSEFYFHEFMSMAASHGMSYLADSFLGNMFVDNLPEKAATKLKEIKDIVKLEQYQDFVTNRRFRTTILCRDGATINRNLSSEVVKDIYFTMPVIPEIALDKVDFKSKDFLANFHIGPTHTPCTIHAPIVAAALYVLNQNPGKFMNFDEITASIKSYNLDFGKNDLALLHQEFLNLIFRNMMSFSCHEPKALYEITKKPKVSDLALHQAGLGSSFLCNKYNDTNPIDENMRNIILNIDGTNSVKDLESMFAKYLEQTNQNLVRDGKTVTDEKLKAEAIGEMVGKALQFCKVYGYLVA